MSGAFGERKGDFALTCSKHILCETTRKTQKGEVTEKASKAPSGAQPNVNSNVTVDNSMEAAALAAVDADILDGVTRDEEEDW